MFEALAPRALELARPSTWALALLPLLALFVLFAPKATAHEHRSYELVTPVDKGGGEVDITYRTVNEAGFIGVSPDGSAVSWMSNSMFLPENDGGSFRQMFVSTRGSERWSTQGISPPLGPVRGFPTHNTEVPFASSDLSRALVYTPYPLTPDATDLSGWRGLYLRDNATGDYTLVTPPAQVLPLFDAQGDLAIQFGAATPDLDHIVSVSRRPLLPDAPPDGTYAVYEWTDGGLRLASILPDDACAEPPCVASDHAIVGARLDNQAGGYPGGNPISEDGSRIFFGVNISNVSSTRTLYVREAGTSTTLVSASELTGEEGTPHAVQFLFATTDGSKAFFASNRRLTDDSTAPGSGANNCATAARSCDLYLWDASGDSGERITNLTPDPADELGGRVIGDVAATDDGSHFYFVAGGVLAPGATQGANNLYLWKRDEGLRHVTTLAPGTGTNSDVGVWTTTRGLSSGRGYRHARLSDDGERLLFASRAQLTSHDNAGTRQIYLYDAADDEITCVSCSPLSEPSTGDATLLFQHGGDWTRTPIVLPRNLSNDGGRAFFETADRLVSEDVNNRTDVYEWNDGELRLVSDGSQPHASRFLGASADGSDVFFITRARLSGWDDDNAADVYRATTGQTFPEPRPTVPCVGDECQGPTGPVPSDLQRGSTDLRVEAGRTEQCAALIQTARARVAFARRAMARAARRVGLARRALASGVEANRAQRAVSQARQARRQARRSIAPAQRARQMARNCLRGER